MSYMKLYKRLLSLLIKTKIILLQTAMERSHFGGIMGTRQLSGCFNY